MILKIVLPLYFSAQNNGKLHIHPPYFFVDWKSCSCSCCFEEVLRLSDEFISVMQHILNFVQGLNSSSLPLKNCSLDPVPQNMTDLIRFADCQIYPPQSLSPNLSMDNAELMINFSNTLRVINSQTVFSFFAVLPLPKRMKKN
jgi:hypothetical protein